MSWLEDKRSIIFFLTGVSLICWFYWFVVIFYRIYQTIKQRRICSRSLALESHVRKQYLYNLETALRKDSFLLVILALETVMTISLGFIGTGILYEIYSGAYKITNNTFSCEVNTFLQLNYDYPEIYIVYIPICMLLMTQVLVIAYLNLYIAARYLKHEVTRKTRLKFINWWILQWIMLAVTSIQQFQLFSHLLVAIILAVNLQTLNCSRKKLCKAIQSKIDEIRNFEWNPAQFRNQTINLRFYNITMKVIILVFLIMLLEMLLVSVSFFLQIILTGNCFLKKVYSIEVNLLPKNETKKIYDNFEVVIDLSVIINFTIIIFSQIAPSLIFVLIYLANYIYDKCTGKGHTYRIHKALLEPMLQNEYD